MSSITRHHAEWLSLLEISGPFLSMPVLLEAFPQGLDAHDPELSQLLRAAHEEWADNQAGLRPDPAIHTAWVHYVLEQCLGYLDEVLLEGQAIPNTLKAEFPEHGLTLRPDLVLVSPRPESGQRGTAVQGEGMRRAKLLIKVYPKTQELDKAVTGSHWKASISTQMMELLHATDVKLGLVTNGEQWMLVHAPRGETTGFISWYAHLWFDEALTLRAFRTLLGLYRFFGVPDEKTLEALLAKSAQDQQEVTDQLGYQVRRAVEILIGDLDKADLDRGRKLLAELTEERLYEAALTVMMRLVFLLSAEERSLLPLDDPFYAENYAVSTLRAQLREIADHYGEDLLERRTDAWNRLLATFRAVYAGVRHDRLTLIAYGGSLFDPDRFPFLEGRPADTSWKDTPADPLPVDNRTVLHLLDALQILQVSVPGGGPAEARRLSFRALDIEQIGHVYEGLLDHIAVRAEEPVLGLIGTKDKEPEIPLSALESQQARGQKALVDYLRSETGRTKGAVGNGLDAELDAFQLQRLRAACGNDEILYKRVLPFAGLLREDDSGFPVVIPEGSVYVTAGPTRRATGTHYTPRSLTEPIVQHTLEPQVYEGPAEGWPKEKWALRSPKHILELKVCDMAMGSGAFLIQACRYLSERLVEAWEDTERAIKKRSGLKQLLLTAEGLLVDNPDQAVPPGAEDRLALARRLVADRCLYGVDKNPLAVEMAKLSLWLVTLDKNRPFTFLNHALKCGDSLVGTSEDDFLRWAHTDPRPQATLFDEFLREKIETSRKKRKQLQSFQVLDVHDAEQKAQLLEEADRVLEQIKLGCDLLIGVKMLGLSQSEQNDLLTRLVLDYVAGEPMDKPYAEQALSAAGKERVFHWEFEFPEVFERSGFNTFVGNPPFMGGQKISGTFGDNYLQYLKERWSHSKGSADICAYFFLQGYQKLSKLGTLGLIATNTIAQGVTRDLGLLYIVDNNGSIYWANNSMKWPGAAAVVVSIVHIFKGKYEGKRILDENNVEIISSLLDDIIEIDDPCSLLANSNKSFQGSNMLGLGFTMSPDEAKRLISKNPLNAEVLFPYINGHDLNTNPDQSASRWVIYFFDWPLSRGASGNWKESDEKQRKMWLQQGIVPRDYPGPVAHDFPDCISIVREKVYPQRQKNRNKQRREIWWRFTRPTTDLYNAIKLLNRALVIAQISQTAAFAFVPNNMIFSHRIVVFAFDDYYHFSILQSSFHEQWARRYSSTLKNDLSYTPSTAFQTFPFPTHPKEHRGILEKVGEFYDKHRSQVMLKYQEGLTAIYNRFHDPEDHHSDIIRLRELHMEIDLAVAFAYGWEDLDLGHDFHETPQGLRFTVSEVARREILTRLLESNYRRYQEEVARGLHKEKGSESSHKERSRRATKTRNRKKSSPKSKQVAEQSPGYQVRKGRPKAQPSRAQASFLDIVDETVPDVLTRMPFFGLAGSIYCSPMPFGRNDPEGYAYQDMRRKGVSTIVMLASDAEAEAKAHRNLRKMYQKDGFNVIQFPIPDYQIPGRKDLEPVLEQVLTLAKKGENIAVHCSGGVGRTGLFMAELAKKALKMSGQSALYWVRLYIPGAVETKEQERFVVGNE